MDINKAKKVVKLLEEKTKLDTFLESLGKVKDLEKVIIHFDCFASDGTVYPCFCQLPAYLVLPCIKKALDGIERKIENL